MLFYTWWSIKAFLKRYNLTRNQDDVRKQAGDSKGRSGQGRGNIKCKSPKMREVLSCLRNSKVASMAREEKVRGKMIINEAREIAKGQVTEGPLSPHEQIWVGLGTYGNRLEEFGVVEWRNLTWILEEPL